LTPNANPQIKGRLKRRRIERGFSMGYGQRSGNRQRSGSRSRENRISGILKSNCPGCTNWPADHAPKVPALINDLENREKFEVTKLEWASGLMIVVRTAA